MNVCVMGNKKKTVLLISFVGFWATLLPVCLLDADFGNSWAGITCASFCVLFAFYICFTLPQTVNYIANSCSNKRG